MIILNFEKRSRRKQSFWGIFEAFLYLWISISKYLSSLEGCRLVVGAGCSDGQKVGKRTPARIPLSPINPAKALRSQRKQSLKQTRVKPSVLYYRPAGCLLAVYEFIVPPFESNESDLATKEDLLRYLGIFWSLHTCGPLPLSPQHRCSAEPLPSPLKLSGPSYSLLLHTSPKLPAY